MDHWDLDEHLSIIIRNAEIDRLAARSETASEEDSATLAVNIFASVGAKANNGKPEAASRLNPFLITAPAVKVEQCRKNIPSTGEKGDSLAKPASVARKLDGDTLKSDEVARKTKQV
ncbi:hypothetical protein NOR_02423 [Metarhizium rileyi]|uniref:Uncharacterized protein n=1 Tax=Metarhizium rileyi (strain RCEF 4871) TaxID=1649241 RepID=A0A167HHY0_METRR|nr:hypothetical protein NOR_02423 [Metarhizium rileyi RCEF 4871]